MPDKSKPETVTCPSCEKRVKKESLVQCSKCKAMGCVHCYSDEDLCPKCDEDVTECRCENCGTVISDEMAEENEGLCDLCFSEEEEEEEEDGEEGEGGEDEGEEEVKPDEEDL